MTSRRRQPGDRQTSADRGERKGPKERSGHHDRETPKKGGRRLSRATRAAAAPVSGPAPSPAPPRRDREDETGANKKTPQQFSRCKPWTSTINSPSNDGDQQQDIFWDPQSPTTFKLENGKKKLSANKCKVDIADIVNRIAPKGEKPSSSDAAYLGIWIGDDAIPCTPVVARTRTRLPRSRILQTEEELMKLAMQLDSNLIKQKDHSKKQLVNPEGEMSSECNAMNNEDDSFLEGLPEEDDLALQSVSQRSAQHKSSQRSVDQEAEAAFNAMFDSSTQKCSGQLSQGLSEIVTSSLVNAPRDVKSNVQEDIGSSKKEQCSENQKSRQSNVASEIPANAIQDVKKCSEQNNGKEKEGVQSVSGSQDDFEDDWENDLLEDDSFIMQVTQNPELIATPKNSMPPPKPGQTNAQHAGGQVKSTAASYSKTNNFKFVSRKVDWESEAKPSNPGSTKVTSVNPAPSNSRDTHNAKAVSMTSTVPTKPQTNVVSQVAKKSFHNLVPAHNSTSVKSSQKPCVQAAPQTRVATASKDSVLHDDWDDLKFSDEVLDMFCESDSLWEEKKDDDDDDLLYQVCDDVERLTQAQETNEKNPKKEMPQLLNSTCQVFSKSGTNPSQQNRYGNHVSASSPFGSNKLSNRGVSPSLFSGNCSNASQNISVQKSNQTSGRSGSVPSGGECKNIVFPSSTHSQNPGKSLAAAGSMKNPLVPTKYSFTRIKPSQVTSVHTAKSVVGSWSSANGLRPQSFGDSRSNRDTRVQSNSDCISKPEQSSLKRHFSESTIQSPKVFSFEDKNKKCSMEEIERKKQEALARRKMKARASSSDTAPT